MSPDESGSYPQNAEQESESEGYEHDERKRGVNVFCEQLHGDHFGVRHRKPDDGKKDEEDNRCSHTEDALYHDRTTSCEHGFSQGDEYLLLSGRWDTEIFADFLGKCRKYFRVPRHCRSLTIPRIVKD